MSDNGHFDKFLQEQFNDYAPEVASDSWEKIKAQREKEKRRFYWWKFSAKNLLIIAALLLSAAAGIYFLNKKTEKENIASTEKAFPKSAIEVVAQNEKAPLQLQNDNHQQLQLLSKKNQLAQEEKKEAESTKSEQQKEIASFIKKNVSGSEFLQEAEKNNVSNGKKVIAAKNNSSSSSVVKKQEVRKLFHDKIVIDNNAKTSFFGQAIKKINAENKVAASNTQKKTKPFFSGKNAALIVKTNSSMAEEIDASIQGDLFRKLQFDAEKIHSSSLHFFSIKEITKEKIKGPDCPVAEKNAAGNKTYFELYASPDMTFKKYSDTANSVFLQKRKESTQLISAFSAGFRFTKVFQNGVSIRSGINYSQVNEKFSFIQGNWVQISYNIDPITGDTSGINRVTGTRYKNTINRYRTIDIPVLLGYEFGNGKFHFNLNAGPVINIYSWQKGDVLDTAFKPVSITTNKGNAAYQYKTNTGIGFMGAFSIYYKLNDRLHLLAEPYLRYNFSPMNKDIFSLQEKFTTIGLRLGVRVDF